MCVQRSRSLEYRFLVILALRYALQYVCFCSMLKLLLRNPNKNVLLAPYLRGHLQRADIEKSVTQMVDNSRIRLFSQECFIRVDRISRQQTLPSFWYVFLYVFEELGRGLLWRDF